MLVRKVAIFQESFVAKLANDPIKVEKYKNFKMLNGQLEKFKKMNTIAKYVLNMFHFYHLMMQVLILSLEGQANYWSCLVYIVLYKVYLQSESGDVDVDGVAQSMSQLPILLLDYVQEDVYSMDEIRLYSELISIKHQHKGR